MAADRIWRLFPLAPGRPDLEEFAVWVEPVREIAVAPLVRTVTRQYFHPFGAFRSYQVREPRATITVRMRWRADVGIDALLVDDVGDGRTWAVNGVEEVGRRQWLDVSCTLYDIDEAVQPSGMFTAPAGWTLQDADGDPVQELTIGGRIFGSFGETLAVRFRVPAGGWQIAQGFDPSVVYEVDPTTEVNGSIATGTMRFRNGAAADVQSNLAAGELWPVAGVTLHRGEVGLTFHVRTGDTFLVVSA